MIDWINRREAYSSYAWRRLSEEMEAIAPNWLQHAAEATEFLAQARKMAKRLGIGVHAGGEIFASLAVVIAATASPDSSQPIPPVDEQ